MDKHRCRRVSSVISGYAMSRPASDNNIDWLLRSATLLLLPATVLFISTATLVDEGKWMVVQLGAPVIAALWMVRATANRSATLPFDPLSIAMYLGLASMAVSILPAINPFMGIVELSKRFSLVCVFVLMVSAMSARHDRMDALWVLVGTSFIGSVYGIAQHFGYDFFPWAHHEYSPIERGVSFYGHATFAGSFLAITIPLAAGLTFVPSAPWKRMVAFLVLAALVYHLYFTAARGATIGVLAAVGAVLLMLVVSAITTSRRGGAARANTRLIAGIVVLVISLGIGFYFAWRAWSIKDEEVYVLRDLSAMLRLYTWETGLRLFLSHPILGVGTGNYEVVIPLHWNGPEANHFSVHGQIMHQAHNEYIETAAEQGLIGFAVLAGTILFALAYAWDAWRNAASALERRLGLALFGSVIAGAVDAAFIFSFQTAASAIALWAVFGIIAAQRKDLLRGEAGVAQGLDDIEDEIGNVVVENRAAAVD